MPFAATWMQTDVTSIILTEVGQKKKDESHMLSLKGGS